MNVITGPGNWPTTRMFHHGEFPVDVLARLKGDQTVSVCLPVK